MNVKSGVYRVYCLANRRMYIGSSGNLESRLNEHQRDLRLGRHPSAKLQADYNRWGKFRFRFEILELVRDNQSRLDREQHWIDSTQYTKSGKFGFGYNLSPSSRDSSGVKWSGKSRELASAAHSNPSGETRDKMSKAQLGRKHSNASKAKMSLSHLGRCLSDKTRTKIGDAVSGSWTPERRKAAAERIILRCRYENT